MNIQISFKNLDSSDRVKAHTEEQSERLKKYFQGKISLTWNFSRERENHIAHCHLVGNGMNYFGESESIDFFAAIDQCIEKIEKQLRKHKEIVTDHHQS